MPEPQCNEQNIFYLYLKLSYQHLFIIMTFQKTKVPKLFLSFFEKMYTFVLHIKNTQNFTAISDIEIWTISNLIWIRQQ